MRLNEDQLRVVLRALKAQYNDGPDDEDHAIQLHSLIDAIERWLGVK